MSGSVWMRICDDGRHRELTRLVKSALRDPNSFEHDHDRYVTIVMKYRARNGFGGMTVGYVHAQVQPDGSGLRILESE